MTFTYNASTHVLDITAGAPIGDIQWGGLRHDTFDSYYRAPSDNVTKHWYDRGAAGWRFDVANEISHDWWREYRPYAKSYKADGPLVGEIREDASQFLAGDQLDSVMNYRFETLLTGDTSPSTSDENTYAFARVSGADRAVVVLNNGSVVNTSSVPVAAHFADGTSLVDVLTGTNYTIGGGHVAVTLAPRTGVVLLPTPDWLVLDAHHLQLRAERSGRGAGRVYTIIVACSDAAGNTSSRNVTVTVPRGR